eukprot:CAMPEP_0117420302 /NCGR_PEP_ID=MMETSP0758-20121206/1665_1 /TAXON_ID=63605 /ORGANISM="Percolomonas cosmopolitus, Strain AE-1 (ATCC 50343)" /LENGTH=526 /DNA_ID=CAMNT_0005201833 /DNA_START=212 /DNA_END=1789 /DNA_ORIENTATION=+
MIKRMAIGQSKPIIGLQFLNKGNDLLYTVEGSNTIERLSNPIAEGEDHQFQKSIPLSQQNTAESSKGCYAASIQYLLCDYASEIRVIDPHMFTPIRSLQSFSSGNHQHVQIVMDRFVVSSANQQRLINIHDLSSNDSIPINTIPLPLRPNSIHALTVSDDASNYVKSGNTDGPTEFYVAVLYDHEIIIFRVIVDDQLTIQQKVVVDLTSTNDSKKPMVLDARMVLEGSHVLLRILTGSVLSPHFTYVSLQTDKERLFLTPRFEEPSDSSADRMNDDTSKPIVGAATVNAPGARLASAFGDSTVQSMLSSSTELSKDIANDALDTFYEKIRSSSSTSTSDDVPEFQMASTFVQALTSSDQALLDKLLLDRHITDRLIRLTLQSLPETLLFDCLSAFLDRASTSSADALSTLLPWIRHLLSLHITVFLEPRHRGRTISLLSPLFHAMQARLSVHRDLLDLSGRLDLLLSVASVDRSSSDTTLDNKLSSNSKFESASNASASSVTISEDGFTTKTQMNINSRSHLPRDD